MDSLVAELKASEMWVCVSIWLYGKFRSQCQGNSTEQLPQNALIAGQPWHTAGTERAAQDGTKQEGQNFGAVPPLRVHPCPHRQPARHTGVNTGGADVGLTPVPAGKHPVPHSQGAVHLR